MTAVGICMGVLYVLRGDMYLNDDLLDLAIPNFLKAQAREQPGGYKVLVIRTGTDADRPSHSSLAVYRLSQRGQDEGHTLHDTIYTDAIDGKVFGAEKIARGARVLRSFARWPAFRRKKVIVVVGPVALELLRGFSDGAGYTFRELSHFLNDEVSKPLQFPEGIESRFTPSGDGNLPGTRNAQSVESNML